MNYDEIEWMAFRNPHSIGRWPDKEGSMTQELTHDPKLNRILAALPVTEYARLESDLTIVELTAGQILYGASDDVEYVYFPITSIVSLIFSTEDGSSSELAMTGNDGLVGIPLVLGGATTTHKVVVQTAGTASCLRAEVLSWELDQGGELQRLCLCYAQALMTQMAQSVVCNRHHSLDQQLCRWLLLSLDQIPGNVLNVTQELIASMLGVRREGVTQAAGKLQAAGLIQYQRGHITVTDRSGLEARACECYGVVRSEYDRLFMRAPANFPKNRSRPNPLTVRQRAEARFKQTPPVATNTNWEAAQLLHELQVHQIELEMHNEELRNSYAEADDLREKYADIYDFAPVAYFTLNAQGVILQLNLAGAILLGIKRSQNMRHRFAAAVNPEYLPMFQHFFDEVLRNKSKKSCEMLLLPTSHNPEAFVRIQAVPGESGEECRMVVMDITAEKLAEKALNLREQYLRTVLNNFPFLVWLKDEQSRFLAVNAPFAENFGWPSPDSLRGKTDFDITTRELAEHYRAGDQAVLASGKATDIEELIENNGEARWFETYKSPIIIDDTSVGTVGFARDITKRRQMEEELRKGAATDPLTQLASREYFLGHLEAAHSELKRDAFQQIALLTVSLDYLSVLNDTLGLAADDAVLRLVSNVLRDELRKMDSAGVIANDRFAVLMLNSDLEAAQAFAERLMNKVAVTKIVMGERQGVVTISMGIATMSAADSTAEQALNRADEALCRARAAGPNRIACASPPDRA